MFLAKIVFAVFTCTSLVNYVFVAGQDEESKEEVEDQQQEEEKPAPQDNHTFVALIDILFTNGRKQSCTGTIIHDNVVITAAHCFVDSDTFIMPELTASFVVIGTKKMFDTGYENYLPIERVITHPNYKGWTADIALVFTFAGMTSDKPGNVIPLVGDRTLTPLDSNVTVLSWGHCKDEPGLHTSAPYSVDPPDPLCDSDNKDSCEAKKKRAGRMGAARFSDSSEEASDSSKPRRHQMPKSGGATRGEPDDAHQTHAVTGHGLRTDVKPESLDNPPENHKKPVGHTQSSANEKAAQFMSRYLPPDEKKNEERKRRERDRSSTAHHRYYKAVRNKAVDEEDKSVMIVINTEDVKFKINKQNKTLLALPDPTRREEKIDRRQSNNGENPHNKDSDEQTKETEKKIQSYFKNWRRQMGTKENKLTVEVFGFVNVQTCKKIVEKALPAIYGIDPNHVVCYATEEHYITDEDSGAPAIRQGHLVAVTVGGVSCEGDHVAIGMKMSCFCTWIAENLPDGGENMNCCKDCCDGADRDEIKYYKHYKHKNKYLY